MHSFFISFFFACEPGKAVSSDIPFTENNIPNEPSNPNDPIDEPTSEPSGQDTSSPNEPNYTQGDNESQIERDETCMDDLTEYCQIKSYGSRRRASKLPNKLKE